MRRLALSVAVALWLTTGSATAASVDYGPISHKGLKSAGAASTSLKLSLQLGLIADQQGIANAAKAASSPTSSSYGKYPSLSTLQSKYGASSSRRNAVLNAFDNLYVVDTSFFPSIGAANPALTAMANAVRVGDHLLGRPGAATAQDGAAHVG